MNTNRHDAQAQTQLQSRRRIGYRPWHQRSLRLLAASGVRVLRFCLGAVFVLLSVVLALLFALAFGLVLVCRDERVARCLRLAPGNEPAVAFMLESANSTTGAGELSSEFDSAIDAAR